MAVREREYDGVMSGQLLRRGSGQGALGEWDQVRVVFTERASGVPTRRQLADLDVRMTEHQAKEFATCIATRACYRDLDGHAHEYAPLWKSIQRVCGRCRRFARASRQTGRESRDTPGSWARHTVQLGATRAGLGAQGGVVGGGGRGDCGVAGGGGFGDGEGAIGGAEAQREGQGPLACTDLVAGVDVEQPHIL